MPSSAARLAGAAYQTARRRRECIFGACQEVHVAALACPSQCMGGSAAVVELPFSSVKGNKQFCMQGLRDHLGLMQEASLSDGGG